MLSTKLRTGIVGLPNIGKSTLFNALVGSAVAQAANYPFCTIDPNFGIVNGNLLIKFKIILQYLKIYLYIVPDSRLATLAEINKSVKTLPGFYNHFFVFLKKNLIFINI